MAEQHATTTGQFSNSLEEKVKNALLKECESNPYGTTIAYLCTQIHGANPLEVKRILNQAAWSKFSLGRYYYVEPPVLQGNVESAEINLPIDFLFVRKGVKLRPYMDGGAQERGNRAGTENIASIIGMAAALKDNCHNLVENFQHQKMLEERLLCGLTYAGVAFSRNGGSDTIPGIMSLSFAGKDGEAILHRLDLAGISISTGSACDGANTEISHVLRAIRLDKELAVGTIRISLGRYNTEEDVDRIVFELAKIAKE